MEALDGLKCDTTEKTELIAAEPPQTTLPQIDNVRLLVFNQVQVAKYWPLIRIAVQSGFPESKQDDETAKLRILKEIREGSAQVLGVFCPAEQKFAGMATTIIRTDEWTDTKMCIIFSMFMFRSLSAQGWRDAFMQFEQWAKQLGCDAIQAYSPVDRIREICDTLGFDTEWRRLYKEIEK